MNAFNTLFTTYYHEIKYALIFSAMNILWMLGEKLAGLHDVHIADYTNFHERPQVLESSHFVLIYLPPHM